MDQAAVNARMRTSKARNVRIHAEQGCIICQKKDGIDPAHWPTRRGHGAGWGLLEFLPLCRREHRLLDDGDPVTVSMIEQLAPVYYRRMYLAYRHDPKIDMGPQERIEEVMGV